MKRSGFKPHCLIGYSHYYDVNMSMFVRMFPCHKSGSMAMKDGSENISYPMGWGKLTAGQKKYNCS